MSRILNFSAGPAHLPHEVLKKVQADLLDWNGRGFSVMEMSHRSADFMGILKETEDTLRELLKVPENYKVLFMQGGGTGQFAAVPMNLLAGKASADYIVTGTWSSKAVKEAKKYCEPKVVTPKMDTYTDIPDESQWSRGEDPAYLYYCDNETVVGVEFPDVPDAKGHILVADISSNFLTRPVDVSKFGVLYAGAQKNAGPAGVTVVIVREDLIGKAIKETPVVLDYKEMADADSMPNTPPTWSIYVTGLVAKWVKENGGLEEFERRSKAKAGCLYELIDNSSGFYTCPVAPRCRSRINVVFRIGKDGAIDEALETKFVKEAAAKGMVQLKGHRSVGGIRASLYNATTLEDTLHLADFMKKFAADNS